MTDATPYTAEEVPGVIADLLLTDMGYARLAATLAEIPALRLARENVEELEELTLVRERSLKMYHQISGLQAENAALREAAKQVVDECNTPLGLSRGPSNGAIELLAALLPKEGV